jgi:hypothetical protein
MVSTCTCQAGPACSDTLCSSSSIREHSNDRHVHLDSGTSLLWCETAAGTRDTQRWSACTPTTYSSATTLPPTDSTSSIRDDCRLQLSRHACLTTPHQSDIYTRGTARTHSMLCHLACVSSSAQQAAGGAAAAAAAAASKAVEQLRVTATSTTPARVS